ncbi:hypothetical protein [Alcaligenes aquatilis]|uniref:hypothetical protein n=1 Tax=Alcaligenes aquatilis TaxID=323284 RepID=UPI003616B744
MTSTDQHTKALGHLAETATSLTATVGSHNVQIAALGVILSALLDEAAADPQRAERLKALIGQQVRSHARLKTATTGRDVALAELTEQLRQLLPKALHPEPLDL